MDDRPDEDAGPFPTIPGYECLRVIGRGGMGDVCLARQLVLGREVAIKFLKPTTYAFADDRLARFRREAELMARVRHPNILSVYDYGTADGRPYLVMEYVEGGDLRRLLTPGRPIPLRRARSIAKAVGDALSSMHRQGILHRDLKPENILLHEEGHPIVADFGIAVLRTGVGQLTGTRKGMGTPGYIAPEQQFALEVDERADQYSLAALAYEMITGQVPLGAIKPPSSWNDQLDPAVDAVVLRALQEDPDERFPTIRAFCEALESAFAKSPRRRRFLPGRALAIGAVGLGIAALIALAWAPGRLWTAGPPPVDDRADRPPPAPRSAPPDPAAKFIEAQLEARAYRIYVDAGKPPGTAKADWTRAVDELLGGGPLAEPLQQKIDAAAYLIWIDRGRLLGDGLDDWLTARSRFLADNGLAELVRDEIEARAYRIWESKGKPSGLDAENRAEARRQLLAEGLILPARARSWLGMTLALRRAEPWGPGAADAPPPGPPVYVGDGPVIADQFRRSLIDGLPPPPDLPADPAAIAAAPLAVVARDEAIAFCRRLSAAEGRSYRLPTPDELAAARPPDGGPPEWFDPPGPDAPPSACFRVVLIYDESP